MRLVTYERAGARRLGATTAGVVVDLPDAVGHPAFPRTMEELVVHNGGSILAAARSALEHPDAVEEFGVFHPRLLAPLLPSAFVEVGGAEAEGDRPPWPPVTRAVMGPGERIAWPASMPLIGCHVEVGCVVGRTARDMSARDAGRAVFGYTVMIGWSAADPAFVAGGSGAAASFATSLGPWIVTPDEVDLDGTLATAALDGEVVATAVLRPGHRSFVDTIAGAARTDDVGPGDVFGSTSFGASFQLTLDRRAGSRALVEITVEGIGSLATRLGR